MLNLLHTSMDLRALGILFLMAPLLLFFVKKTAGSTYLWLGLMIICSTVVSPLVPTAYRIFSSGIGAGSFLLWLGLYVADRKVTGYPWGYAMAMAIMVSVALRTLGHTQDIAVTGETKYIGWLLAALAVRLLIADSISRKTSVQQNQKDVGSGNDQKLIRVLGLAGCLMLIYFTFTSPGVITRWTGASYAAVILVFSGALMIWILVGRFGLLRFIVGKGWLLTWNFAFLLTLVLTLVLHTVRFPVSPESDPVMVTHEKEALHWITYIMLMLSPVIFVNISNFTANLKTVKPSDLGWPFLWMVIFMIVCIFMLIFSNTWGYVGDLSRIFRNKFYLPFVISGIVMILPYIWGRAKGSANPPVRIPEVLSRSAIVLALGMFLLSVAGIMIHKPILVRADAEKSKLTVMTYNIQQGVDLFGNKNFEGQLGLVKKIDPDILCLQESDAARISGGNSDITRYFSNKLNYHCYYGPKTVTGTYGTAILSRYPLRNCRTVFTYSDKDEIGTAFATIQVRGKSVIIANSHPAGGKASRQSHIDMLMNEASIDGPVVAMGDYNFRQSSPYHQAITGIMNDAWLSLYPDAVGPFADVSADAPVRADKRSSGKKLADGRIDMRERIDHIFLSDHFEVLEAYYLPTPESQTDHPAHWVVAYFNTN
jgi:endonuclease/exonuclease/phosphatase family metal-dependent hydrolase